MGACGGYRQLTRQVKEKLFRDVAKSDKLRPDEALPCRSRLAIPRHSSVDGLRADADYRREGPAGVAEDLDPKIPDSVQGATEGVAGVILTPLYSGGKRRWGCRPRRCGDPAGTARGGVSLGRAPREAWQ